MRAYRLKSAVVLALLLGGCSGKVDSIECLVPTYDMPDYDLGEVEAGSLASMCTESWAKLWAAQSKESAGDIADAVASKCDSTYTGLAYAKWPQDKWPLGTALSRRPEYVSRYRGEAVAQVIQTRRAGCTELTPLEKHKWLPRRQP